MKLNKNQRLFKLGSLLVLLIASSVLSSCGGSGVCASDDNKERLTVDLQLDYVGAVPVLNGGATASYFYVHNDGDKEITGISYTLGGAISSASGSNIVDSNGFTLKGSSLTTCASIAPHSACRIDFVTPTLSAGNQNNSLFKVSVTDAHGFVHNFDQVINYVDYNVLLNNGVNFATSADVVAHITNRRYMMAYLIAGGVSGQSYNNINLEISNGSSISINDGFINGTQMVSGELIPIEFNVRVLSVAPSPENISPQYEVGSVNNPTVQSTISMGQSLYISTSSQMGSTLALKTGLMPILSAPTSESNAALIYVSNFGEGISGFSVEPADSNIIVYANNCSSMIESNSSCSFKVGVNGNSSGSSEVSFKVNGQTVLTNTVYYTAPNNASLISSNLMGLVGLNPNQSSSIINLPFTNLSDKELTDLLFNPVVSGGSTFKIISNGCGTSIPAGGQCVVQVQLIGGASSETGAAYLNVTGKYNDEAFTTKSGVINYYTVGNTDEADIVIDSPVGSESSVSILGNGIDTASAVYTISNPGSGAIPIGLIELTGVDVANSGLVITGNTCGNSLAAGATCQITVTYGPLVPESNNSGVANLQIRYGAQSKIITGTINYSVVADNSYLQITNVVAGSGFTGSGTLATPYLGSGCNNAPLTLTITYKNMSQTVNALNMALELINNNVSPYMSVESSATTCGYGANPKDLSANQSCDLVLVAKRSDMKYNSSFNLNVVYPSASWNTSKGFIKQAGFTYENTTQVYADYTQPVLVSTTSSASNLITMTQTLVGADSCGEFKTIASAIPNIESTTVSGNCELNSSESVVCTNTSSAATNTIIYQAESSIPKPVDLFTMLHLETSDKQVWYNPQIVIFRVTN